MTALGGGITEILMLMPFIRGTLLATLNARMMAKSQLTEQEVLDILVDVVAAISRLHQCATPIVHRDLKVENVLEEDGKYILCDFGSATAKMWDPAVHGALATQEDLEKYTTLAYRSPEMVDLYSNRGAISCKSDIWALGVFLYKVKIIKNLISTIYKLFFRIPQTCFYTTPFGDSVLAIQSANLTFPPQSSFSLNLHALMHYLLTPDQDLRPDIYQVAEIVHALHGTPNPIKNVNCVDAPPSIDLLIANMTQAVGAKAKPEEKPIKSASVTPAPALTPLETSVTPRQRPKGTIVLTAPTVGATLLPPPKSPKAEHVELRHRRNVSDSSTFEKLENSLDNFSTIHKRFFSYLRPSSQQSHEINSATSEQAISSWNPFDREPTANEAVPLEALALDEDDPFEKAPFGMSHLPSPPPASPARVQRKATTPRLPSESN